MVFHFFSVHKTKEETVKKKIDEIYWFWNTISVQFFMQGVMLIIFNNECFILYVKRY